MKRHVFLVACLAGLFLAGCTKRETRALKPAFVPPTYTDILCAVYDMSGSYAGTFDQKAYPAAQQMFKQFKRDLIGESGTQVLLANISSAPEGPFFRGDLGKFSRDVRNAGDFSQMLKKYGGASRVFDSITEACELMEPSVLPESRAFLGLFTDFDDNLSAPGGEDRMVEALKRLAQKGVSCGCYWVPRSNMARTESYMKRSGFKHYIVAWEHDASITLPSFEK